MTEQQKEGHARALALRKVAKEIADGLVVPEEIREEIRKRSAKYLRAMKQKGIAP